jgi:hypothetical protein
VVRSEARGIRPAVWHPLVGLLAHTLKLRPS